MKKKKKGKLTLDELTVESFVTALDMVELDDDKTAKILGGATPTGHCCCPNCPHCTGS